MAGRTHGVPRHAAIGPEPPFVRLAVLVAEDIKPLTAPRIVRQSRHLPSSSGKPNEELPQRIGPDDAFHRVLVIISVRAQRTDQEPSVVGRPRGPYFRFHGPMLDGAAGIECGSVQCRVHRSLGQCVVRGAPALVLIRMAIRTAFRTGKPQRRTVVGAAKVPQEPPCCGSDQAEYH